MWLQRNGSRRRQAALLTVEGVRSLGTWEQEVEAAHTAALRQHNIFERSHANIVVRQSVKRAVGWTAVTLAAAGAVALVVCGIVAMLSSGTEAVMDRKGRARRMPEWAQMNVGPTAMADVEKYAGELMTSALHRTAALRA
ncbi:hypothetical protein CH253_26690 [Rhodococcus sp. 06-156-3C]|nr:hypothetical protein CH253_26690 [Rhodococcus sp. 06-156-3C]OZD20898.1 hypothetical protein CH248_11565 [Rhodococcus sp. 06-156-4a]OZD29073.1 hypothetical protein CH247_19160 [Rhodococcus sp. 06-156-3b]OZD33630.1 hypothetical protein CH284_18630 [Rhodococcus sp. 06-156-3]OZF58874.1 hypothetical protein CH290_23460 [Rhodococcus sp. 06-156-4]